MTDQVRVLGIGTDLVQCSACKKWYQSTIKHVCLSQDLEAASFDYYGPANRRSSASFNRMRCEIARDVDEVLDDINAKFVAAGHPEMQVKRGDKPRAASELNAEHEQALKDLGR